MLHQSQPIENHWLIIKELEKKHYLENSTIA